MICELIIENFKAFTDPIKIENLNGKNLVVCGENGAGKTSVYEALKLVFYRDVLLKRSVSDYATDEERESYETQFDLDYTSKKAKKKYEIRINGVDHKEYIAGEDAFFISYNDFKDGNDVISFNTFFGSFFTEERISHVEDLWGCEALISDVNNKLKIDFHEDIEVGFAQGEGYRFCLKNSQRNLESDSNIDEYFNEARVHIVKLVIMFTLIEFLSMSGKERILVIDDIISSLDAANRALIVKYIINHFKDYQKIIFTHNVSFFSLFHYAADLYDNANNWEWKSLYESSQSVPLLINADLCGNDESIDDIVKDFKNKSETLCEIGNRIRKKLESTLYECVRYMQFGNYHEVSKIFDSLVSEKPERVYLRRDGDKIKTVYDLIEELRNIVNDNNNRGHLRDTLMKRFKKYDVNNEMETILPMLKDMKLFQKLLLHPLSHATEATPTFSKKEIEVTLTLLIKIDKLLKGAKKKNGLGFIS